MTSTGKLTSCPSCNIFGVNPVLLLTMDRMFMPRTGRYWSHSRCFPRKKHRRKFKTMVLYRSTCPLELGRYGVVLVLVMSISWQNDFITEQSKFLPWSVCTTKGTPNLTTYVSKKDLATVWASWILRGTISTHRENWSTIIRTYLLPTFTKRPQDIKMHPISREPSLIVLQGCFWSSVLRLTQMAFSAGLDIDIHISGHATPQKPSSQCCQSLVSSKMSAELGIMAVLQNFFFQLLRHHQQLGHFVLLLPLIMQHTLNQPQLRTTQP